MTELRGQPTAQAERFRNYETLQDEDRFVAAGGHAFLDRLKAICDDPSLVAVSFDFFDTIVWRPYQQPVDLFWELGERLVATGILPVDFTPAKFMQARIIAEGKARQRKTREGRFHEVSLAEIYAEFTGLGAEARGRAADTEVAVEAARTCLDPVIAEAIDYAVAAGKQVLIISNTYLSREQLAQLLVGKGAAEFALENIHCSSDYGIDKEAGLVSLVLSERRLQPSAVLHVGDSWHADVDVPGLAGVRTLHYPKFVDIYPALVDREAQMRSFGQASEVPVMSVLQQVRRSHLNATGIEVPMSVSERIGAFIVGPTLAAYAHWLLEEVERQGNAPVLCLTREGLLLSETFQSVAAQIGRTDFLSIPFLSSRAILFSASFFDFSEDELETFLLSRRTPFTMRSFCTLVGLDAEKLSGEPLPAAYLDFPLIADTPLTSVLIAELARNADLRQQTLAYSAARRDMFKRYVDAVFARHGVGIEQGHLYVADVGWSGRSQRLLERILGAIGYPVSLHGLYMATDTSSHVEHMLGLRAKGWLYDGGSPVQSSRLGLQSKEIIEQVCSSHLGAVNRYDDQGDPVFGSESKSFRQRNELRKLRNAARGAIREHGANHAMTKGSGLVSTLLDAAAYRNAYAALIAFPSDDEFELFGTWAHEENNLSDNVESLSSPYWRTFAAYATPQQFLEANVYWKLPEYQRTRPALADGLLLKMAGFHASAGETPQAYSVRFTTQGENHDAQKLAYFSADGRAILSAARVCDAECSVTFRNLGARAFVVDAVLTCVHDTRDRSRHEKAMTGDLTKYPETSASAAFVPEGGEFTVRISRPAMMMVPLSVILCVRVA
ncbi:hypothetical protein [Oryzibacter oryziterrae]|uniref:hypothetical protein n=1 Tax=Oryzibacter oryziterrae TaxID=2766474 RepID=UPI001F29B83C|nr:hypothetical protein [Oryzibacter oryziterrae]